MFSCFVLRVVCCLIYDSVGVCVRFLFGEVCVSCLWDVCFVFVQCGVSVKCCVLRVLCCGLCVSLCVL